MSVNNPYVSRNFSGTFVKDSKGFVQGGYAADGVAKTKLVAVKLDPAETLPMWGGIPIEESMSATPGGINIVARASTYADVTGFAVNAQTYNALVTTDNTVPVVPPGADTQIFRMGSGVRIYLPIDPALDLTTLAIGTQVSWDFTNNQIIAFNTTALPVKVLSVQPNSLKVSYNALTGNATWTVGAIAEVEI